MFAHLGALLKFAPLSRSMNIWDAGDSAYISTQEIIQLLLMAASGLIRLKVVVEIALFIYFAV